MAVINPLVPETAGNFKNFFKTADNQAFEVKFRRDAHKQINIQGVVMGFKRFGRGAAGQGLQNRRLHL